MPKLLSTTWACGGRDEVVAVTLCGRQRGRWWPTCGRCLGRCRTRGPLWVAAGPARDEASLIAAQPGAAGVVGCTGKAERWLQHSPKQVEVVGHGTSTTMAMTLLILAGTMINRARRCRRHLRSTNTGRLVSQPRRWPTARLAKQRQLRGTARSCGSKSRRGSGWNRRGGGGTRSWRSRCNAVTDWLTGVSRVGCGPMTIKRVVVVGVAVLVVVWMLTSIERPLCDSISHSSTKR